MATFAASIASAPPSEARSFSTAAMEPTKMAGWEMTVESSSALSPAHLASRS